MMGINLGDLQRKKNQLEKDIFKLIKTFEEETNTSIYEVDFEKHRPFATSNEKIMNVRLYVIL